MDLKKIDTADYTIYFSEERYKYLADYIKEKKYSMWWENILYELIGKQDINVKNIENRFWAEVDYIEDYERILKFRKYNINYNIAIEKKK